MKIHNLKKISFVHGWLFGSYIWGDIKRYFSSADNLEMLSMPGYDHHETKADRTNIIDSLLVREEENSLIIAYSYAATSILFNRHMNDCKSTVLLINPFIKPKTSSVNVLLENINSDFDNTIKKFIYNSVKSSNNHLCDYRNLINLFYDNPIPSLEVLNSELRDLLTADISQVSVCESSNIRILLSEDDEVADSKYTAQLESMNFSISRLDKSAHYPFFDFDKIYDIIKSL